VSDGGFGGEVEASDVDDEVLTRLGADGVAEKAVPTFHGAP